MQSRNPYFIGQPVPQEYFVGRDIELATAFDQIANRGHLAIWGGPKVGKSSFLQKLVSPQTWEDQQLDKSGGMVVHINCLAIHPFNASNFWQEVLESLKQLLDCDSELKVTLEEFLKERITLDGLRKLLRGLGKQNKFLLLLVDDFDAALCPNPQYQEADIEAFLSECRSLSFYAEESRYFSMIVVSSRRLNELGPAIQTGGSPWYNHYLFLSLKPFTDKEIDQLLGQTMTWVEQERIKKITGRNPALLQMAGYMLYQARVSQGLAIPHLETFVRELESRTRPLFHAAWNGCNTTEQMLLMLIALTKSKGRLGGQQFDLSGIDKVFSQLERDLRNLEERGFIISTTGNTSERYTFDSSIMEWWVIQELASSNDAQLRERQQVFLGLMNRQEANKLMESIQWLGTNSDKILKRITDLANLLLSIPK